MSFRWVAVSVLSAGAVVGCALGGLAPSPAGLAYGIPDPNPATYTFGDTAAFEVEAGAMGVMEVVVASAGIAELSFRDAGDELAVSASFPEFRASFENPGQPRTRIDESAIGGPLGLRLGFDGTVEVVDTPMLGDALLDVTGPEALARLFFIHLPGRPVDAGAAWVDTVRTTEEAGGTRSTGRSIITTTLVGDTSVEGRTLLLLTTAAANEIEVSGVSGGVEILQRLDGTTRGTMLWDPARRLLIERREEGRLTGTLAMPGMGVDGLPVRASVRRVVSLRR